MNDAQRKVIEWMSGDYGYPFARLSEDSGVPVKEVRDIVRGFHRDGLAEFGPLYSEDDYGLRGKGYWLNDRGWAARRAALGHGEIE